MNQIENASAGNRTRVTSMATMYSTTRPLMPVPFQKLTMLYASHVKYVAEERSKAPRLSRECYQTLSAFVGWVPFIPSMEFHHATLHTRITQWFRHLYDAYPHSLRAPNH